MQNEQQIETPEPDEQQLPPAEPPVVEDISEKLKPTTHDYVQFGSELVCQSRDTTTGTKYHQQRRSFAGATEVTGLSGLRVVALWSPN